MSFTEASVDAVDAVVVLEVCSADCIVRAVGVKSAVPLTVANSAAAMKTLLYCTAATAMMYRQ
jgi:hypothetical protein